MVNPKQKSFEHWLLLGVWCLFIGILPGCASIKEAAKGLAGVSTKVLDDGRKDAIKKTFSYDYNTCYNKVKTVLKQTGSYIYAEDPKKNMIAIYVSGTDTTAVGIFFKEIDATKTQIEVSSPSSYAKELIATRAFSVLGEPVKPEEKKG